MVFAGLNVLAILLAALAAFIFGAAYYTALSKPWFMAVEKTREQLMPGGKPRPGPLVLTAVALILMAWVLAGSIGHLGTGQVTLRNGAISGLFMWAGFVATTIAVNNAFAGRKRILSVIDGIHWLAVLVIEGAVIGAMGV